MTLYLSNWSSHRTPGMHGPGRKWTIMARPRAWEHGDGVALDLAPTGPNTGLMLRALEQHRLLVRGTTQDEAREACEAAILDAHAMAGE